MSVKPKPKILILDIETKPALSYHWRMFKENIGIGQVKEAGGVICFGAKWFGERPTFGYSVWEHGKQAMLEAAHSLISEADAVVTKNGDKFDIPHLMTEFITAGMAPPPPTTSIDLEKTLRYKFRFLSNKLDFVVQHLEVGKKVEHEGFKLWRKVMDGDEKAQKRMMRYCLGDVRITDKLYRKMRPYITNHPHLGEIGKRECGACGSDHVHVSKWRRTKAMRIQQLHCQNCGSYFDGIRQKVT